MLRPEHTRLVAVGAGLLDGTLENVVYFGTDTHYHVRLDGGAAFIVRQQNSGTGNERRVEGDRVGLAVAPGTAQVLRD